MRTCVLHFQHDLLNSSNILVSSVDMVRIMVSKLNWPVVRAGAQDLSISDVTDIETISEAVLADEGSLRRIHHVLFEVNLIEGFLVCPESGRKFPVNDGIPNMLLHEDEI